jgi:RND superfamily putative drug exporter
MSALARWCTRRRSVVIGAWLIIVVSLGGAAIAAGSSFTNYTTLPDSEPATAYQLLAEIGSGESADKGTGNIVWQTEGAGVDDAGIRKEVTAVLDRIAELPGVEEVVSPYSAAGSAQLDADRNVAYARVSVTSSADVDDITDLAKSLDGANLEVQVGGRAFEQEPSASGLTEIIGILGALAVLLLVFRSVWAALLPIITGVAGVTASLFIVMLASNVVDLADSTPTMGALIGLGVGIDYALFIVNRYRKAVLAGESVPDAIAQAITTSGRAVIFAGATVVIALLGMFVVQLDILTGMARAAALTVVLTVAAAVTLLPALLSKLGLRVLSRKQRARLAAGAAPVQVIESPEPAPVRSTPMTRWSALVERRPRALAMVAVLVMTTLAIPALSMRLGSADASSDPADSDSHEYYSMMAGSFGDGFDAPLLIVASTPDTASATAFAGLVTTMKGVDAVADVFAAPTQPGQPVSVATVTPTSSAQTEATADLVERLRDDVIPAAEQGSQLEVYVGGTTATNIDNGAAITEKLPLYLALIAVLGFILLVVAFRSILVPLIGALANLLTLLVALGATTAVFQHGWGSELLGVGTSAPIEPIVPVLVIGIMFGLSMDYQVFLVSRMHEEWTRTPASRSRTSTASPTTRVRARATATRWSPSTSWRRSASPRSASPPRSRAAVAAPREQSGLRAPRSWPETHRSWSP